MLKKSFKSLILNLSWLLLGRKNLLRLARFLYDGVCLDINNNIKANGEMMVQSCILAHCSNNICVFDVGANIGEWTRTLCEQNKNSQSVLTIHAFEPARNTYQTLKENINKWAPDCQLVIQNTALSSTKDQRFFYSIEGNVGVNGFYPIDDSGAQVVQEVAIDTIDNYCEDNNISHIDFIKIDTEGHDLEVLLGAENILSSCSVDFVQFEYNNKWIDARNYLRDAFDYLLPKGFVLGKITPKGIEFYPKWDYELESFKEANYIAMKSSSKDLFPQIKWWKS
ncbi:MAG: hypothetical protein CMB97_00115 [Flavobacteriaceae bacterium]|nr:hypothetical protein [Flavobacteriaceae bacterium]